MRPEKQLAKFLKANGKKNPQFLPPGEQPVALLVAGPGEGAWERLKSAPSIIAQKVAGETLIGTVVSSVLKPGEEPGAEAGDAAAWPRSDYVWIVLTDRQLHVFEGVKESRIVGKASAHYPLSRITAVHFEKKAILSRFRITFTDGSVIDLDAYRGQRPEDFAEVMAARFPSTPPPFTPPTAPPRPDAGAV